MRGQAPLSAPEVRHLLTWMLLRRWQQVFWEEQFHNVDCTLQVRQGVS
jgi:hypothetical protein